MMMDILLPILIKCMAGIKCDKPFCNITVAQEKQLGHLTPKRAHTTMLWPEEFGDNFEHLSWQYLFIRH